MISTPIDALRSSVNTTFTNATSAFDVELLPIPEEQSVEICTNLDTTWIDDVGSSLGGFVKLFIGLTVLAMALFVGACFLWERYRYSVFITGVSEAREAWIADLLSSSSFSTTPARPEETLAPSVACLLTALFTGPSNTAI